MPDAVHEIDQVYEKF